VSSLTQLQQRLGNAVIGRETSGMNCLLAGDPIRTAARASIYMNNHHIGLRDALGAMYPVVARLLGPECFELLARSYVNTYPMPSGNLLDFGESLSKLIVETEMLAALPYLADMARLEWLRHQVWRAGDCDPEQHISKLDIAALDDVALAKLRVRLVPAAKLFQSQFPVVRIWQTNQHTEPAPVSLDEGGVTCLLLREGFGIRFESLSHAEFIFLAALDQQPACAAVDAALEAEPRFDLALSLARWLNWLQYVNVGRAS